MEFSNFKKIEKLKALIKETYTPLINADYVMLDFPNYRNIGDNLIWKGEEEFMKTIPYKCVYQANIHAFEESKIPKDAVILLQGGGNFGDIYNALQEFRLKIIQKFPNNKIIIFPQTIHYNNESEFSRQAKILKSHKNLYITARDHVSKENLKKQGIIERVLLLPDMAFCIDFTEYFSEKRTGKSLYMKRNDTELNKDYTQDKLIDTIAKEIPENKIDILDWPSYSSNSFIEKLIIYRDTLELKLTKTLIRIPLLKNIVDSKYGLNPKNNLEKYTSLGINFLNGYDLIYTTRLHGFILSILLNKEVKILDNSYGKNSNFYNSWIKDFDKVELIKKQ